MGKKRAKEKAQETPTATETHIRTQESHKTTEPETIKYMKMTFKFKIRKALTMNIPKCHGAGFVLVTYCWA